MTCHSWIEPNDDEIATAKKGRRGPYGRCRFLSCAKRPLTSVVIETEKAMKLREDWTVEFLRTMAGFSCQGWKP